MLPKTSTSVLIHSQTSGEGRPRNPRLERAAGPQVGARDVLEYRRLLTRTFSSDSGVPAREPSAQCRRRVPRCVRYDRDGQGLCVCGVRSMDTVRVSAVKSSVIDCAGWAAVAGVLCFENNTKQ